MKYCPYCGAAQEVSAALFCPECGADLSPSQPKTSSKPAPRSGCRRKKKKRRTQIQTKAAPAKQRPADDDYDGYYRDTPVTDGGQTRIGLDPVLTKKIIILAVGVLLIVGLAILAMQFL